MKIIVILMIFMTSCAPDTPEKTLEKLDIKVEHIGNWGVQGFIPGVSMYELENRLASSSLNWHKPNFGEYRIKAQAGYIWLYPHTVGNKLIVYAYPKITPQQRIDNKIGNRARYKRTVTKLFFMMVRVLDLERTYYDVGFSHENGTYIAFAPAQGERFPEYFDELIIEDDPVIVQTNEQVPLKGFRQAYKARIDSRDVHFALLELDEGLFAFAASR